MILALTFASSSFAQENSYGLQPGSFGVFAGGGTQIHNGAHPAITGGIDLGLTK
jgi:hypothetical protein